LSRSLREDWGFPNPATPPGSSAYYSLRFSASPLRDPLAALHGWRHQVRAVLGVSDPGVAAAKLAWWRDELKRGFAGHPSHPLGKRLAATLAAADLPPKPFLDIAWSAESVLARHRPRDFAGLAACAEQDLGALFELVLRLDSRLGGGQGGDQGGDPHQARVALVRRLGAYASLVYWIRDCGLLLRQGHPGPFPAERLAELGLTPLDLYGPKGRHLLPRLLAGLADEARGLRGGESELRGLPRTLRIRLRILDRLLAELAASGFDLADRRLALTPLRKLTIAWREGRRPAGDPEMPPGPTVPQAAPRAAPRAAP
jgi:phytoene synthase